MTGDLVKLLPRAMGQYIYQNRYDFFRGVTFTIRDVLGSPAKQLDLEECRNRAYERLMRDIPFVIEALKGGELKLDTNANNIAARLGMIAYDVTLASMPSFRISSSLRVLERPLPLPLTTTRSTYGCTTTDTVIFTRSGNSWSA